MIYIGLHRGTSFVSRLIRFWTRSPYSHAEFWFYRDDSLTGLIGHEFGMFGSRISADAEGVVEKPIPGTYPSGKLAVDLFEWEQDLNASQEIELYKAARTMVGWRYSYGDVFIGFPLKTRRQLPTKYSTAFCSEVVLMAVDMAARSANVPRLLERHKAWKEPPQTLYTSPVLEFSRTVFLK